MTYLGNLLPHADVRIFPFFSVEPQVLLFSLAMVTAFPILQQGNRLGWFSIQNRGAYPLPQPMGLPYRFQAEDIPLGI